MQMHPIYQRILKEAASISDIATCIRERRVAEIRYDDGLGGTRRVEVYLMGVLYSGNQAIRAYQISGPTKTQNSNWKIFRLDKITEIKVLDETFDQPRAKFNKYGDKTFSKVTMMTNFDKNLLQKAGTYIGRKVHDIKKSFKK